MKMFKDATKLAALFLLAAGAWGASTPSVNRAAAVANLSDAQIESNIKARLARSPKLSLDKFTVKVQGGIATLEGKTNVIQHKGGATRMAKTSGARAVVNNIHISDAARKAAAQHLAESRRKGTTAKVATSPASSSPAAATPTTRAAIVH